MVVIDGIVPYIYINLEFHQEATGQSIKFHGTASELYITITVSLNQAV
jgi:hypothetical protein